MWNIAFVDYFVCCPHSTILHSAFAPYNSSAKTEGYPCSKRVADGRLMTSGRNVNTQKYEVSLNTVVIDFTFLSN